MNVQNGAVETSASSVRHLEGLAALSEFMEPECAGLVWRRDTPARIVNWLSELDTDNLPTGRTVLRPEEVSDCVQKWLNNANTPPGPERQWLQSDIASLAAAFADMMHAHHIRLRLDMVTTNACRRFHVDAITARLVCTYRGTGTQYGFAADNRDPAEVFTVPTGSPILLRGKLWPAKAPSTLLHRSPPIEGTGEARLVLVVDPVFGSIDDL